MKIVNAIWEKRNLGMESYEIILSPEDCTQVSKVIAEIRRQNFSDTYVVIKIPVGHLELLHKLECEGFNFLETQFFITKKISGSIIPQIAERMSKMFTIEYLGKEKNAWKNVISKISDNLFTTDRVFLDPLIPKGTSAIRYKNWMRDLFDDPNAWLAIIKKNDEPCMFNLCINNSETSSVNYVLAGVFENYKNSGMGIVLPIPTLQYAKDYKYEIVETSISSNNLSILRLYEYYGFETQTANYVLRKKY